jgi:hypothetical protein
MYRSWAFTSAIAAALFVLANASIAQERQRVTFSTSREHTNYTQQHLIEVGDVPRHEVRVFEIHRTFPKDAPTIGGLGLKEQWSRGVSDYIDGTGTGHFYGVYVLENGDSFFTHSTTVAHKAGSGLSAVTAGRIIGGTGRLENMRGEVRMVLTADPEAGINDGTTTIEYTLAPQTDARREPLALPPTGRSGQR